VTLFTPIKNIEMFRLEAPAVIDIGQKLCSSVKRQVVLDSRLFKGSKGFSRLLKIKHLYLQFFLTFLLVESAFLTDTLLYLFHVTVASWSQIVCNGDDG